MSEDKIKEFHKSFHTAFINKNCNSNLDYKPQFIYNDNKEGKKSFHIYSFSSQASFRGF